MTRAFRLLAAVAAVLLAVPGLAGCADTALTKPSLESRVDVGSAALRAQKADLGIAGCPARGGSGGSDLPQVTLPCLGGGNAVTLSGVRGPALLNLWASWCVYCPDELPLFQRLADRAGDRLTVLGIDWQDTRPGLALELLRRTRATYPQLADPGGELSDHYRMPGLPAILFVDRQGNVTFRPGQVKSYAQLTSLVAENTGLRVGGR